MTIKKLISLAAVAAALAGCNRSPEFYFESANFQVSAGKDAQALEAYNRALLLRRNFPEALTARGLLYERQGDRQKAGLDYKRAIEADSAYLPAYNNMAALLMDTGNYREAASYLTAALAVKPAYSYALLNRGLSFYKLGDCASATEDLTRALELNNKFEMAYYHRALCARRAKDITGALADLDAVLALNPAAALAWQERGKIKFNLRNYAAAALDFSKSSELGKEDPVAAYWLALALYKSGYVEGALENALRAAALNPDSYQTAALLGDLYAASRDVAQAKASYLRAAGLYPRYEAYYKGRAAALGRTTGKR